MILYLIYKYRMESDKICVVFTCNEKYFDKFLYTCGQLIKNGNYQGDICLMIGDDLKKKMEYIEHPFIIENHIQIKYFPDIYFTNHFLELFYKLGRDEFWIKKIFQYHKLHLFDVYFKKWDFIFYIDCGVTIYRDITPMLNSRKNLRLLAHSDSYPTYQWRLNVQFDSSSSKDIFDKLNKNYDLNIDYFQTTIMLYDTQIIEENTFFNLHQLMLEYPISKTNDQGIIALYFTNVDKKFEQIKIKDDQQYFYDYLRRDRNLPYIMLKMAS